MADKDKKQGEPFPGTVEERPGTPLGGFADRDDTADADTQPQPVEPPPTDPGNLPEPPRKPGG